MVHDSSAVTAKLKQDETVVLQMDDQQSIVDSTTSYLRVAGVIPIAAFFIVVQEGMERFAYYGGSTPFQNYIQLPAQNNSEKAIEVLPGALDMGQDTATACNLAFTFCCYATPLIGAYISDQYWGKYKTIFVFSLIYMIGWTVLFATSVPVGYGEDGIPLFGPATWPGFIASLVIIGMGTGGIKSLVSPFCADQIPAGNQAKVVNGQTVLVDRELTIQHLYNWFYWAINIGAIAGQLICTTLERSSFWEAFLCPVIAFFLSIALFVYGRNRYIQVPPEGSVYSKLYSCIRYAWLKKQKYPESLSSPQAGTSFPFLDYSLVDSAAITSPSDAPGIPITWNDEFVYEVRKTLKACLIFPAFIIYWVVYSQMTSNLISQAGSTDRPYWLSNDVINIIDPLFLIVFIPLFDYIIYPWFAKRGTPIGLISRITLGFFLASLSMAWACYVQNLIYTSEPGSINVFMQIPAYCLIAASEIFASIASLEYAYTHAPKSMTGMINAFSLLPVAGASAIGLALSPLSQDPYLTWNYGGCAVASFVTCLLFWWAFKHYDQEDKDIDNALKNRCQ